MGSGDETNPLHTVVAPGTNNIQEQVACWPSADLYFTSQLSIELATETLILLIHSDSCQFFSCTCSKRAQQVDRSSTDAHMHGTRIWRSTFKVNGSSVLRACMCVQHSAVHIVVAGGHVYNWINFVGCRNLHLPLFSVDYIVLASMDVPTIILWYFNGSTYGLGISYTCPPIVGLQVCNICIFLVTPLAQ